MLSQIQEREINAIMSNYTLTLEFQYLIKVTLFTQGREVHIQQVLVLMVELQFLFIGMFLLRQKRDFMSGTIVGVVVSMPASIRNRIGIERNEGREMGEDCVWNGSH